MKSLRAKQILITGLVALVLAAGYYRWTEESKSFPVATTSVPVSTSDPSENNIANDYKSFEDENAIYANADAAPSNDNGSEGSSSSDNFDAAKRERDSARGQSLDILNEVLENDNSSKEAKEEAQKKINDAASNSQSEGIIEGLVKAKGYEDCIVYIENQTVRVVVKADELEASGVSQIKDIVVSQTGIKPKDIKISSKK